MKKCDCGNAESEAKMITSAIVAEANGCTQHILGTKDTQTIDYRGLLVCKKCGKHHLTIDGSDEADTETGRRCTRCACGNTKFLAHQRCYHDIFVNTDNIFHEENGIYEAGRPYGSYISTKCGAVYDELKTLIKMNDG